MGISSAADPLPHPTASPKEPTMQPSTSSPRNLASATVAAGVLVLVLAVAAFGGEPVVWPSPSPTPQPSPTAQPSPSAAPSDAGAGPVVIDLDLATDHAVSVTVDDATGDVVDVRSGQAGAGMSVRWGDVLVTNVDARTIQVTWVGLPIDEQLDLVIGRDGETVTLAFEQDLPPAFSDAMGLDRVLVVTFADPVDADDVEVTFPAFQPA
jgi:hypothetical protein